MKTWLLAICMLILFCLQVESTQAARYSMSYLAPLSPGRECIAYSINNAGTIVGDADDASWVYFAAKWSADGSITNLGTIPGGGRLDWNTSWSSTARSINNNGQIVGAVVDGTAPKAAIWSPGNSARILPVDAAVKINDLGQIMGQARMLCGLDGSSTRLPVFSNDYDAWTNDINNKGQTAGCGLLSLSLPDTRAVFWPTVDAAVALAVPAGAIQSEAWGLNDLGVVVGDWDNTPCMWTTEGRTDLAVPASFRSASARCINNLGQIVGTGTTVSGSRSHVLLWDADGTATDLGVLCGTDGNSRVFDINDCGQIVGIYQEYMGLDRAVLWTPIPEPSSLLGLLAGLGGLGGAISRRREGGEWGTDRGGLREETQPRSM
jgi:probable HAF family extracellular repeat protein